MIIPGRFRETAATLAGGSLRPAILGVNKSSEGGECWESAIGSEGSLGSGPVHVQIPAGAGHPGFSCQASSGLLPAHQPGFGLDPLMLRGPAVPGTSAASPAPASPSRNRRNPDFPAPRPVAPTPSSTGTSSGTPAASHRSLSEVQLSGRQPFVHQGPAQRADIRNIPAWLGPCRTDGPLPPALRLSSTHTASGCPSRGPRYS